jgi:hypothetical protein
MQPEQQEYMPTVQSWYRDYALKAAYMPCFIAVLRMTLRYSNPCRTALAALTRIPTHASNKTHSRNTFV